MNNLNPTTTTATDNEQRIHRLWGLIRGMGKAGFVFFTLKGLAWLAAPLAFHFFY